MIKHIPVPCAHVAFDTCEDIIQACRWGSEKLVSPTIECMQGGQGCYECLPGFDFISTQLLVSGVHRRCPDANGQVQAPVIGVIADGVAGAILLAGIFQSVTDLRTAHDR